MQNINVKQKIFYYAALFAVLDLIGVYFFNFNLGLLRIIMFIYLFYSLAQRSYLSMLVLKWFFTISGVFLLFGTVIDIFSPKKFDSVYYMYQAARLIYYTVTVRFLKSSELLSYIADTKSYRRFYYSDSSGRKYDSWTNGSNMENRSYSNNNNEIEVLDANTPITNRYVEVESSVVEDNNGEQH